MVLSKWLTYVEKTPFMHPDHVIDLVLTCTIYDLRDAEDIDIDRFIVLLKDSFSNVDEKKLKEAIRGGKIWEPVRLLATLSNQKNQGTIQQIIYDIYPWARSLQIVHNNGKPKLAMGVGWDEDVKWLCRDLAHHEYLFEQQVKENKKGAEDNLFITFLEHLAKKEPSLKEQWNFLQKKLFFSCDISNKNARKGLQAALFGQEDINGLILRPGIAQGKATGGIANKFFCETPKVAVMFDKGALDLIKTLEEKYKIFTIPILASDTYQLLKGLTPYFRDNHLREHILDSFRLNSPLGGRPRWRVVFSDLCIATEKDYSEEIVQNFQKLLTIIETTEETLLPDEKIQEISSLLASNPTLANYLRDNETKKNLNTLAGSIEKYSNRLEKSYATAKGLLNNESSDEVFDKICEYLIENESVHGIFDYGRRVSSEVCKSTSTKTGLIKAIANSPELTNFFQKKSAGTNQESNTYKHSFLAQTSRERKEPDPAPPNGGIGGGTTKPEV
jgi:hypothetical protein